MAYRKSGDNLTIDEILNKIKYAGKKQPPAPKPVSPVYAISDMKKAKKVLDRIKEETADSTTPPLLKAATL